MTATAPHTVRARPHQRARHPRDLDAPAPPRAAAPLLAVCGVCGGAGASTISALIASAAAAHGHVLVADTGGPSGGLSARTGVPTPWSLPEAAELLVRDPDLARQLWAAEPIGASSDASSPPRPASPRPPVRPGSRGCWRSCARDLHHTLVVIDCGTLQHEARPAHAARRLTRRLGAPRHRPRRRPRPSLHTLLAPRPAARELILARRDPPPRPRRCARSRGSPPRARPARPPAPPARRPPPRAHRRPGRTAGDPRRAAAMSDADRLGRQAAAWPRPSPPPLSRSRSSCVSPPPNRAPALDVPVRRAGRPPETALSILATNLRLLSRRWPPP